MITAAKLLKEENSISYGFAYENTTAIDSKTVKKLMIDFAKIHVKAALKSAAKKAVAGAEYSHHEGEFEDIPVYTPYVVESSILNAYPLDLIK